MYIYYKIKQENIYDILSSLILNVGSDVIYKAEPQIDNKEILVRIRISEKFNLIDINNNIGTMNRIFNLETTNVKFYFNSRQQIDEVLKLASIIKEIKIGSEELENYFYIYNNNTINLNYDYKPIEIIHRQNKKILRKLDILKGILYCTLLDKNKWNKYIIDEYTIFYEEYKTIENMIYKLQTNGKKNLLILKTLVQSKKVLKKEIEKNLALANYENMIINSVDRKQIIFNNKFLCLSNKDKELFDKIMNLLINKLFYIEDNKMKMVYLVKSIKSFSDEYNIDYDYKLVYKRVIDEDFSININQINNVVLKNLFAACIKYNDDREFSSFLLNKGIEKKYIAYMFLGSIVGFRYLSSSLISLKDSSILKDSLNKIENMIINQEKQKHFNRLKIHYYLDKLYNNLNILKNEYSDIEVKVDLNNKNMKIYLNELNVVMNVDYYKRNKNMANCIKYYDNRTKKLIKMNKEYINNSNIYFNYNFAINKKIKPLDYRFEDIYSTILEYIYLNVRKKENG